MKKFRTKDDGAGIFIEIFKNPALSLFEKFGGFQKTEDCKMKKYKKIGSTFFVWLLLQGLFFSGF